jgi:hypothetical protein
MLKRHALSLLALATALFGCPAPSAETTVATEIGDDALVIEATADEDVTWNARLQLKGAPPGEYLLFISDTRPTSLAEIDGRDLSTCKRTACNTPGLGRLEDRVLVTRGEDIALNGYSGKAKGVFATVVRRGASPDILQAVGGIIEVEGGGGCGNPNPPELKSSALDAGRVLAIPPVGADAGDGDDGGGDAGANEAPSCEELKTQIDACTNISQPTKDGFLGVCAEFSAECRACLDNVLCGVTEQCDPACGK